MDLRFCQTLLFLTAGEFFTFNTVYKSFKHWVSLIIAIEMDEGGRENRRPRMDYYKVPQVIYFSSIY